MRGLLLISVFAGLVAAAALDMYVAKRFFTDPNGGIDSSGASLGILMALVLIAPCCFFLTLKRIVVLAEDSIRARPAEADDAEIEFCQGG